MDNQGDEDDIPQLSSDTLALLHEFQQERDARAKQFEELQTQAETRFDDAQLGMHLFDEDWNTSQFWYTDETARTLATVLLDGADAGSNIAVVSAPSVYVQLRKLLDRDRSIPRPTIYLLEYDRRFEVFRDSFVPYDFERPLHLPPELKGRFDRIICDPPFLSEDCQTKTALTVRYLASSWPAPPSSSTGRVEGPRLISCTGERMETHILKLYAKLGMRTTTFEPTHSKGLSNEFRCYATFECDRWKWR